MTSFFRPLCLAAFLCSALAAAAANAGPYCGEILAKITAGASEDERQTAKGAVDAANLPQTQNVDPNDKAALISNEAITQNAMTIYVKARETFFGNPDANHADYNIVRVYSEPTVFNKYQHNIIISNPDSPGARLGRGGMRTIRIDSFKFLDKRLLPDKQELRRYLIKATVNEKRNNFLPAGDDYTLYKLILIELKFTNLELTDEDQCLNPLGVRVLAYRIDDDNLTH